MSKKNLADAFNERQEKKGSTTDTGNPAVEQITQSHLPPSRRGKKRLEVWVSPEARKQLKLIAVEEDKSQDRMMADALNMLFAKHGIPPIA